MAGHGGLISLSLSPCCSSAVVVARGSGAGQAWGQQTPGSGRAARGARGSEGVWALAQCDSLQPELREVLAISSLVFLPLAFSAECFTSSLCEDGRGGNV